MFLLKFKTASVGEWRDTSLDRSNACHEDPSMSEFIVPFADRRLTAHLEKLANCPKHGKRSLAAPRGARLRWRRLFGQGPEIFKWSVRGDHAADLIAGSVAKYASSGV
jgi:hypothetical protein